MTGPAAAENAATTSRPEVTVVEADFIHCSTLEQLPGVLDRYYADVPAVDVLVLDLDRLDHEGATVRWEPAEGGLYPHVYGVVPAVAVVEAVRVEHVPGQAWSLPDLSSYDVATGP
jgi:glutathione S-transferase